MKHRGSHWRHYSATTLRVCQQLHSCVEELMGFAFELDLDALQRNIEDSTNWESNFEQLVAYKAKNGNCDVQNVKSGLGRWVSTLRANYKLVTSGRGKQLNRGRVFQLTPQRIRRLEALGFRWAISGFDVKFAELEEFKRLNGHCNVTTKSGPLGTWVSRQRQLYNKQQKGGDTKDSTLTQEKNRPPRRFGFCLESPSRQTPWRKKKKNRPTTKTAPPIAQYSKKAR